MIDRLIEVSLRNRFLVVAFFLLIGGWGSWALLTTPIDAIPDLSDNQVIIFTDGSGRSPQEVEDRAAPRSVKCSGRSIASSLSRRDDELDRSEERPSRDAC